MPSPGVGISVATAMIAAQVDCSVKTAEILLYRRAELIGCNLGNLATAVIHHRVRFERPAPAPAVAPGVGVDYSTGVTSTIGSRQCLGASGTSPSGAEYSTSWAPQTMQR
jgi:hypothetical protein